LDFEVGSNAKLLEDVYSVSLVCVNCGSRVPDVEDKCLTCGEPAGAPNVRAAARKEERDALDARYHKAIEDSEQNGSLDRLRDFEEKVKASFTVVNVDVDFLYTFLTSKKGLYSTYGKQVEGQIRRPAEAEDDKHRGTVESMIFGSYARNIRYGALSMDGSGVSSYGALALRLREIAVSKRATTLEDNSYRFTEKHNVGPGKPFPLGYTATWDERHKLAVAKLAGRISSKTSEAEYPKILMYSQGERETDDFIEVHIYGPFDANAIESVQGKSSAKGKTETALIEDIKDFLGNSGKRWIEE
jgi:hypothetical protein